MTLAALYLAQAMCGPYPAVAAELLLEYGEVPVSRGVLPSGNAAELLASPAGTFSLLAIQPGGVACFIATGEGWKAVQPGRPT